MSLYHEAAEILTSAIEHGGSLKAIVFSKKDWKSDRKTLFALSTESAKWSQVLRETIERAEVLKIEKQLTPVLSLVLTHDLLLAKKGIALPAKHGLHSAISRHKARLTSELTKARLKRGCASLDALREQIDASASINQPHGTGYLHPRWIRVNTINTTLAEELETTFSNHSTVSELSSLINPGNNGTRKLIYLDPNVPNLVAVPGTQDLSNSASYKQGRIIFQDKASCFPAHLLDPACVDGDVVDACAAPGNKTTHLAALLRASTGQTRKIFACEKDTARSETLTNMVRLSGAGDLVEIRPRQDFLKLDPLASEFANVEAILLDPSCSGSGIVGRDEASVTIHLPSRDSNKREEAFRGKKRKRGQQPAQVKLETSNSTNVAAEDTPATSIDKEGKLVSRLANLSTFQLRLLQHAMTFPSAKRITYSTCSLYKEENEHVVLRALLSDVAQEQGWKVLRREKQIEGMRRWNLRGSREAVREMKVEMELDVEEVAEACLRCHKCGEGGTMGFFVVGFVRDEKDGDANGISSGVGAQVKANGRYESEDEEDGWEGFSDDER